MTYFQSTDEFKKYFDLNSDRTYYQFKPLEGDVVGFTVKRSYPKSFRYHPHMDENNNPEYVALIRIKYMRPQDDTSKKEVPLEVGVYHGPFEGTRISLSRQRDPKEPIDLDSTGFFFDHSTNSFRDKDHNGKTLSGRELLDRLYVIHCDTARPWRKIIFKLKLKIRSVCLKTLTLIIKIMRFVLETILGRKLRNVKDTLIPKELEFDVDQMKDKGRNYDIPRDVKKDDSLVIFNYEAPKRLILTFSTLVLLGYTILFFICNRNSIWYRYLRGMFTNTFLSAIAGIFLLFVLDLILLSTSDRISSYRRKKNS